MISDVKANVKLKCQSLIEDGIERLYELMRNSSDASIVIGRSTSVSVQGEEDLEMIIELKLTARRKK